MLRILVTLILSLTVAASAAAQSTAINGTIEGTVVQQPYEWGYQGSKLIAGYLGGDKSGIPADGIIIIPGLTITSENVDQFQSDLQAKLSKLGG